MKLTTEQFPRIVANMLIVAGIVLLLFNTIGFFYYTTVDIDDPHLLDDSPVTMGEDVFWENAYRRSNEPVEPYLRRLTELVSRKMLLIDQQYTKPTIFENWILWIYSKFLGYYEWSDTKKAVRLGGGYCSQHAIVFNNILRDQDIQSRIIKLGGHVLNEVLIDGNWRVYDPDFNVVFRASLKELEDNPVKAYQAYLLAGRPEAEAKQWEKLFATDADNWHYKKTSTYRGEKYYIEVAALYLIWIIPPILILIGVRMRKRAHLTSG
jgi:hypothetical protein